MDEIIILPVIFIMVMGILVVPFITPVLCLIYLVSAMKGWFPPSKMPVSFFVVLAGFVVTVGFWLINPGTGEIQYIVDQPLITLLPQLILLGLALLELMRHQLEFWKKLLAGCTVVMSCTALYWMAIAAVMSAAV